MTRRDGLRRRPDIQAVAVIRCRDGLAAAGVLRRGRGGPARTRAGTPQVPRRTQGARSNHKNRRDHRDEPDDHDLPAADAERAAGSPPWTRPPPHEALPVAGGQGVLQPRTPRLLAAAASRPSSPNRRTRPATADDAARPAAARSPTTPSSTRAATSLSQASTAQSLARPGPPATTGTPCPTAAASSWPPSHVAPMTLETSPGAPLGSCSYHGVKRRSLKIVSAGNGPGRQQHHP